MRIVVDRSKCLSYGNCVAAAGEVFDLDENALVIALTEQPPAELYDKVRRAAALCPVHAIELAD
jgi:ferredoxin